jgi:APA family basic amino acid/polyamine antiporter
MSFILFEVILTHDIGRIAGPGWVILCVIYYFLWRRRNRLPLWGNVTRDWEKQQIEVLTSAEEYEMLEEYKDALARRDKKSNNAKPQSPPANSVHSRR